MRRTIDEIALGDCTSYRAKRLIQAHLDAHPDDWPKVYDVIRAATWKMLAERRADPTLKPWRKLIHKTAQACPDPRFAARLTVMGEMFEMSETAAKTGTPTVKTGGGEARASAAGGQRVIPNNAMA